MSEVLVLQHTPVETLGAIQDALDTKGLRYRYVRGFEGEAVPTAMDDGAALIIMGGPMGIYEQNRYPFLKNELRLIENALEQEVCAQPVGFDLGQLEPLGDFLQFLLRHDRELAHVADEDAFGIMRGPRVRPAREPGVLVPREALQGDIDLGNATLNQ